MLSKCIYILSILLALSKVIGQIDRSYSENLYDSLWLSENRNSLQIFPDSFSSSLQEKFITRLIISSDLTASSNIARRYPNVEYLNLNCNNTLPTDINNFSNLKGIFIESYKNKHSAFSYIDSKFITAVQKTKNIEIICQPGTDYLLSERIFQLSSLKYFIYSTDISYLPIGLIFSDSIQEVVIPSSSRLSEPEAYVLAMFFQHKTVVYYRNKMTRQSSEFNLNYENGVEAIKGRILQALPDGEWIFRNRDNTIAQIRYYKKGKQVGSWIFFEKGDTSHVYQYKEGELLTVKKYIKFMGKNISFYSYRCLKYPAYIIQTLILDSLNATESSYAIKLQEKLFTKAILSMYPNEMIEGVQEKDPLCLRTWYEDIYGEKIMKFDSNGTLLNQTLNGKFLIIDKNRNVLQLDFYDKSIDYHSGLYQSFYLRKDGSYKSTKTFKSQINK